MYRIVVETPTRTITSTPVSEEYAIQTFDDIMTAVNNHVRCSLKLKTDDGDFLIMPGLLSNSIISMYKHQPKF